MAWLIGEEKCFVLVWPWQTQSAKRNTTNLYHLPSLFLSLVIGFWLVEIRLSEFDSHTLIGWVVFQNWEKFFDFTFLFVLNKIAQFRVTVQSEARWWRWNWKRWPLKPIDNGQMASRLCKNKWILAKLLKIHNRGKNCWLSASRRADLQYIPAFNVCFKILPSTLQHN